MAEPLTFARLLALSPHFQIVYSRHLLAPLKERERGSGYVNLSAVERNRKRREEAANCYFVGNMLVIPAWLRSDFESALTLGRRPVGTALTSAPTGGECLVALTGSRFFREVSNG